VRATANWNLLFLGIVFFMLGVLGRRFWPVLAKYKRLLLILAILLVGAAFLPAMIKTFIEAFRTGRELAR
jgi:hypothetical protein